MRVWEEAKVGQAVRLREGKGAKEDKERGQEKSEKVGGQNKEDKLENEGKTKWEDRKDD